MTDMVSVRVEALMRAVREFGDSGLTPSINDLIAFFADKGQTAPETRDAIKYAMANKMLRHDDD